jgi:hypothetical protein
MHRRHLRTDGAKKETYVMYKVLVVSALAAAAAPQLALTASHDT